MGKKKLQVGDKVGPYTLVEWIGRGGNGQVWSVLDEQKPTEQYALKLFCLLYTSPSPRDS